MPLPSPIPHPRSSFGAKAAIDRVLGADWPEGDERALRALSDQWHEAAKSVGPLLEDASRAVSAAVAAFGGADVRQGEALQQVWSRTEDSLSAEAFDELGALAAAGARVIEAAKLEIYVHVARMLSDLETLAALSATTLGVADACAEPVMLATRRAIRQVLDNAIGELNDLGARSQAHTRLGQFSFGAPMLAEQLTNATPVVGAEAAAVPVEGGDVVMAYGVGSLGATMGVAAMGGAGASRATALRGRYGERALRGGRVADVLSAVTVSVITNDSAKWPGELTGVGAEPVVKPRQASREATEALSSLDNPRLASAEPASRPVGGQAAVAAAVPPASESATRPLASAAPPVAPATAQFVRVAPAAAAVASGISAPQPISTTRPAEPQPASTTSPVARPVEPQRTTAPGNTPTARAAASDAHQQAPFTPTIESTTPTARAAASDAHQQAQPTPTIEGGTPIATPIVTAAAADTQRPGSAVTSATRAATGSGGSGAFSFTLSALAQAPGAPTAPAPQPPNVGPATQPEEPALSPPPEPFLLLMQAQAGATATPTTTAPPAQAAAGQPKGQSNDPTPQDYENLIAKAVACQPKPAPALRELPPVHQSTLEASRPEQFGDLRGEWLRLIDAGGPAADPDRATISADVAQSVMDTWLRGEPRAAAPGTPQMQIEERLQRLRPDEQGLARVQAALSVEGHGACAIIVQERQTGERHATTIHNRHGELFYVDAQRKFAPVSTKPPPTKGVIRLDAFAVTADATPIDLARDAATSPADRASTPAPAPAQIPTSTSTE